MDSSQGLEQPDIPAPLSKSTETLHEQVGATGALTVSLPALQSNTVQPPSPPEPNHTAESTEAPESGDTATALNDTDTIPQLATPPQPHPKIATKPLETQCPNDSQVFPAPTADTLDLSYYELNDEMNPPMEIAQLLAGLDEGAAFDPKLPHNGIPPVAPSSSIQVGNADPGPSTGPLGLGVTEWPKEMVDAMDDEDTTTFEILDYWFKSQQNHTVEDTVKYEAAKLQEKSRETRVANRKALQLQGDGHDEFTGDEESSSLFAAPEPAQESSSLGQLIDKNESRPTAESSEPKQAKRKKRQNKISAKEKRRSIQFGLDVMLGILDKKSNKKRKATGSGPPGTTKRSKKNKVTGFTLENLMASNIIEDAQTSSALPVAPGFTEKNKEKALLQLVAAVPTKEQEQAKDDRKKILEATKKFTNSVRSDGKGGWRVKGMKTSLYNYQILGAGFMRDRENSSELPYGGLLCDTMGFGKTIQTLANIVDGRPPDPTDPVKTTLIVVPSQLVSHWMKQLQKHCETDAIGEVLVYRPNERYTTLDASKSFLKHDIVTTTYNEVRRSYPQYNGPSPVADKDKLIEWWKEAYQNDVGPLHKIKFRRIILDGTPMYFSTYIKLPDIGERVVRTEFCEAERIIYDTILNAFFETINGFALEESPNYRQYRCFLMMILKLRMFSSHILTAQDIVKKLLSKGLIRGLIEVLKVETGPGSPSYNIVQWIRMKKKIELPAAPRIQGFSSPCVEEHRGDKSELAKQFKTFMTTLHEDEQWVERIERGNCASCGLMPMNPVITSCMHLYCEECYYLLIKEGERRICSSCNTCIEASATCPISEDGEVGELSSALIIGKMKKQKKSSKKNQNKTRRDFMGGFPAAVTHCTDEAEDEAEDETDEDEKVDWISVSRGGMTSAKIAKIQEIIKCWIDENPGVKIEWKATCLHGKMSLQAHEQSMDIFRDELEIRILIASLKAGGIRLDMSMANKCILVDLWWNEPIQDQAFCRLYRIGQSKDVEFIKIIVKDSID
ncbi:SNF2 family N-terminal domain-containing protein [Aspergillus bertholletiae]|uniref:SNF2 family N-terminal domain-containing protein n=1 Tax=Aspergillus bertholletiae TaxID=1226010 RepID=A0A5N7B6L4_9EURO|nr:SNF2 family N-terminal domain-containing protein [Aspergillus bertholletiae]